MKERKHFQMLFTALLLLIITISLISSSIVYMFFNSRYHDKITDNLSTTGESIANTIENSFFQHTLFLSSELQANGVYKQLRTFSLALSGSNRVNALLRFHALTNSNDLYSETLLYYPDENVLMGHYSGIHALDLRQNTRTCGELINLLEKAESGEDIQWFVMTDDHFPPATQSSIVMISRLTFWTEQKTAPLAIFVLNTVKLHEALNAYATDDISLSLYTNENELFSSTADEQTVQQMAAWKIDPSASSWIDPASVNVRFSIGQTGFSLVLSTDRSHYADATRPMLLLVIVLNIIIFFVGIIISHRLATKFYSPLKQLTDAVADMYSSDAAELSTNSEHGLILSAFDAIHKKLTDMGQMIEANLPSLRRMALHDLFTNSQAIHDRTHEMLDAARIHLPYEQYCVVGIRIFRPDLDGMDEVQRSVIPYELSDRLEAYLDGSGIIYSYVSSERLFLLLNADEDQINALMQSVLSTITAYIEEKRIRMYFVHSEPLNDLAEISYAAQALEERFFDNFFSASCGDAPVSDMDSLSQKILAAIYGESWDELESLLNQFTEELSGCLHSDALSMMRHLGLTLLSRIPEANVLSRSENEQIFNLLLSPQHVLWHIREYPHALREGLESIIRKHSQPPCDETELQTQVRQYILDHMREMVSRNDLAEALHFNASYFSTLFKKQCSVSVSQYISTIKLEYAMSQLQNTQHSVAEISEEIGFSSPQYFIRKFRERYGLTPLEFRKMQMKN